MTAAAGTLVSVPPLRRSAWWLLLAIHVPMIAFVVAQGWLGLAFPAPARRDAIGLVLAVIACAIQLRHSVAAAQGIRPRYWTWTLLILVVVSIVPLTWFKDQIVTMQWFVVASFAMLLPARVALITSLVSSILIGVWYGAISQAATAPLGEMVWSFW